MEKIIKIDKENLEFKNIDKIMLPLHSTYPYITKIFIKWLIQNWISTKIKKII